MTALIILWAILFVLGAAGIWGLLWLAGADNLPGGME